MIETHKHSLIKSKYLFPLKIGINHAKDLVEEKRIYLVNAICYSLVLSYAFILLIGFFFDQKLIIPISLVVYSIQFFVIGLIFYFQHIGKLFWSKLLLVTSTLFTCYIFDDFILVTDLIEFYYVIPALISLCLFEKKWISILFLIIQILLFFNIFNTTFDYSRMHFIVLFVVLFALFYILIEINNKAEKLLQEKQQELKELNDYKSRFFINLSHEIKTPLTLINGYISKIDFKKNKTENQENLDIVTSQVNFIDVLVNDILALSKMDSKNFILHRSSVKIIPFLKNHYENFKILFEKENISLQLKVDSPDISIQCDEKLLSKSIHNLLNNALKFTAKGGEVVISATAKNSNFEINVIDNGIGIPKKDINKIFNRFYQSENHITKSKGTGIGLSFTKSIMEAHNFEIDVTSNPNIKTEFTIRIPNIYTHLKEENSIEKPIVNKQAQNIITNSKKRILIVEDHKQMREYLCEILSDFTIVETENGEEALNILNNQSFDVIVSDYMMPVMDGEKLVKELRYRNLKTPILILTARSDKQGELNMLRLGVDGYLNKPFLEEELLLHINKALESSNAIKEFDSQLNTLEEQSINAFANKFNEDLNEYIFSNIHLSTFGIEDIASHFNYSKSTLNRKVRSILGQTPKEIVMEARLQKARNLIEENPHETKKNIAKAVGISNTSYFFKKLEERFGSL